MKSIKNLWLLILVAQLVFVDAFASGGEVKIERIVLDNISQVDTSDIEAKSISLAVPYPGHNFSGICAVELVADSYGRATPIEKLISKLSMSSHDKERFEIVSSTVIRFKLQDGLFVDTVELSLTEDETFEELILETLGENRTVVIRPRSC